MSSIESLVHCVASASWLLHTRDRRSLMPRGRQRARLPHVGVWHGAASERDQVAGRLCVHRRQPQTLCWLISQYLIVQYLLLKTLEELRSQQTGKKCLVVVCVNMCAEHYYPTLRYHSRQSKDKVSSMGREKDLCQFAVPVGIREIIGILAAYRCTYVYM